MEAVQTEWTVLVTSEAFADPGMSILTKAGCEVLLLTGTKDKAEVDHLLATRPIDAIISRTLQLDAAALRSCPSLKMISKHGVGVNNIDIAAATGLGLPVTSTPGANAQGVVELAIGLMFAAARRIAWLDAQVKQGRWARVQDGYQLAGETLGLVGYGEIGRRVGHVAVAIGMKVAVFDPVLTQPVPEGIRVCQSLDEVLGAANVLSLHLPLTAGTRGLIGARELDLLPDGAVVVNTARGPIIDEEALVAALRGGRLRAAGLDTTEHEPLCQDDPILGLDNVVLTPHVGGSTLAAVQAVGATAAGSVVTMMRGEPVDRSLQVNPQVFGPAVVPVS
jgi:D-3-phosphoglycerate dehydrogenase